MFMITLPYRFLFLIFVQSGPLVPAAHGYRSASLARNGFGIARPLDLGAGLLINHRSFSGDKSNPPIIDPEKARLTTDFRACEGSSRAVPAAPLSRPLNNPGQAPLAGGSGGAIPSKVPDDSGRAASPNRGLEATLPERE